MRSRCRCSMCPAIHINSRSWLRSSSTHVPSDPPLRVIFFLSPLRPQRLRGHRKVRSRASGQHVGRATRRLVRRPGGKAHFRRLTRIGKTRRRRGGRAGSVGPRRVGRLASRRTRGGSRKWGSRRRVDRRVSRVRLARLFEPRIVGRTGREVSLHRPGSCPPDATRAAKGDRYPDRKIGCLLFQPPHLPGAFRRWGWGKGGTGGPHRTSASLFPSPSRWQGRPGGEHGGPRPGRRGASADGPVFLDSRRTRLSTSASLVSESGRFVNDPSAGSPTETLLRLLLPLNDQVRSSSRRPRLDGCPTCRGRSDDLTKPFNR